jgi:class 3 adenylate cyclase
VSELEARLSVLDQAADRDTAAAIRAFVQDAQDSELNRINVLDFATRRNLNEERAISAFLHATRLGLFDLSWNVLCPGCGGVLDSNATLKTLDRSQYNCALCAAGYEPTLDEMVEVSFTVSPRVRRIGAHDPHSLPFWDYQRQMFWCSGIELPTGAAFDEFVRKAVLETMELPPGEKAILSLQLPADFVIVFDPVTHGAHFLDVKGEPTRERQELSIVFNKAHAPTGTVEMRPGPLRLTLENRADVRVLPGVFIAGTEMHDLLGHRKHFLTAKRLLTNQTFRDIYRTDALNVDQRLKITSMTFLFTDLKGSTELYDRVGDLVAYDLVKTMFQVMNDTVAAEAGAVVKTIGDAVMATFPSPERGLSAALKVRDAMRDLDREGSNEDLLLKMGVHEGPCLAVTLNDRLDYFGQTVNIASRVQGLAVSRAILATEPIVSHPQAARLLGDAGLKPTPQRRILRGVADELTVYEIP